MIYWGVYYHNFKSVKTMVEARVDLSAKLPNGEDIVQYAEFINAPKEIIAFVKKAMAAPHSEGNMERGTQRILEVIGQKNKKYALFLTHHKRDAASVVSMLRTDLARHMAIDPSYIFLDSEDLRDLRELRTAVKETLVLVVMLTKDVFTRPWCLAEIITAIASNVPIVSINIEGQGNAFDFAATQKYLQSENFADELESANPGAVKELINQEIDVSSMGKAIGAMLPYIISKGYNVSASERVREAQLLDIISVIQEKI
jgi:hypothetical protein